MNASMILSMTIRHRRARLLLTLAIVVLLWKPHAVVAGGPGFSSVHRLEDSFERYGREFGPITQAQYLDLAQKLRDTRPGSNILESRRPNGIISKFDRKRGFFGSYDPDRTIRSFFIPVDGLRYFERQSRRYDSK